MSPTLPEASLVGAALLAVAVAGYEVWALVADAVRLMAADRRRDLDGDRGGRLCRPMSDPPSTEAPMDPEALDAYVVAFYDGLRDAHNADPKGAAPLAEDFEGNPPEVQARLRQLVQAQMQRTLATGR